MSSFTLLWSACFWKFLVNTFILQTISMFPGDASKNWMPVASQLVPVWSSNIYLLHNLSHHWTAIDCGYQVSCLLWNSADLGSLLPGWILCLWICQKTEKMIWLQVGSCNGLCLKYRLGHCPSDIVCLCIQWEASNETYFLKQISVLGLHLPAYLRCIFSSLFNGIVLGFFVPLG